MSDGLKDCPFCGGGAVVSGDMSVHCAATCEACGATVDATSVTDAVSKWNRRADLCADPALLAEAVEVLGNLLEAISAETQHGDRCLTITGPTANLKWLIEAGDDARAFLAKWENRHDDN